MIKIHDEYKKMIDKGYIDVFRKIYSRLNDSTINWAVTGSFSFALQGIDLVPDDIDIQTDEKGVYSIENLFREYVTRKVKFSSTEKIRSHFGQLVLDEIKVEIMGNIQKRIEDGSWEDPVDLLRYKKFIDSMGMKIPVLSIEYEYQAYLRLGRIDKADILWNWMNDNCED